MYRYLLSGISSPVAEADATLDPLTVPKSTWLEDNVWQDLVAMSRLSAFRQLGFLANFVAKLSDWQRVFDSNEPHVVELPSPCNHITDMQRYSFLRQSWSTDIYIP